MSPVLHGHGHHPTRAWTEQEQVKSEMDEGSSGMSWLDRKRKSRMIPLYKKRPQLHGLHKKQET